MDAEWDDRHERRLKRLLKAARFCYPAAIEEVDFALRRNLDQNQLLRLADCRWVGQHQDQPVTAARPKRSIDSSHNLRYAPACQNPRNRGAEAGCPSRIRRCSSP